MCVHPRYLMNEKATRVKVTTTISANDKEFLEKMHLNASSALAIGIAIIKKAMDLQDHVLVRPSDKPGGRPGNMVLLPRNDIDIDDKIETIARQRADSLQRIMDSTPWKSIDDMAAYFGNKPTTLHGLREVRHEDEHDVP